MASNHVSSDQVPLQGQSIYSDPSYQNLFSPADRYGTPSWDQQLHQQQGLAPNNAPTQTWQHGSFPQQSYNAFGQAFGSPAHGFQTSSPYQYGQFTQQSTPNPYAQSGNVESTSADPNVLRQHQPSPYRMPMRTSTPQNQPGTVTPQALQQNTAHAQTVHSLASPFQIQRSAAEQIIQRAPSASFVQPVPEPSHEIPKGKKSGGFYILDQAALAKATQSAALNKLVALGSVSFHLATNRTALPLYTARQSVRELKKAGADNKKLLAKLSSTKPSVAKKLKTNTYAGSPSALKREVSDSDSDTDSSDEDSEYTDDEENEVSPLPATRPEEPHGAVRYDVIKTAWFPSQTVLNAEKMKDVLNKMFDVLQTIRERWRADSKAVLEAEENKKMSDLPVLKSRVTSQRDLLQSGLEAILEYAHPDVLYNFGQVRAFLYLAYQFLANRQKAGDYTGPLPKIILKVLSRCGTFSTADVEATRVSKALPLFKKHADEEIKGIIQKIEITLAANDKKKAKAGSPSQPEAGEGKTSKRGPPEPSASKDSALVKRVKVSEASASAPKAILSSAPSKSTTASTSTLKKPGDKPTSTAAPIKARVSQVTNKPSGIFASLTAASKKPTTSAATSTVAKATVPTKSAPAPAKDKKPPAAAAKPAFSFAQTMASLLKPKEEEAAPIKSEKQLPPETAGEKAKRMRKESRRHLRVVFKPDAALVQIKYFSHDPEEEMGHDENSVRDAGDTGGEGRMFKQHKELEVDEDDEELDVDVQPWREPSQVDFAAVSHLTQGNYAPYGGGQQVVISSEKEANLAREYATLMVFYSNPSDIPSSPREPLEQGQESTPTLPSKMFGEPPEPVRSMSTQSAVTPATVPVPPPGLDLSQLENIFKQFANPGATSSVAPPSEPASNPVPASAAYMPAPPTADAAPADLQSILNALRTTAPQAQPSDQPPAFPTQAPLPPMPQTPFPADLSAIMSAFQAASAGNGMALPPPPPGLPPGLPPGFPPFPMPFQMPQPDANSFQPQQPQQQAQYDNLANGANKRAREENNLNDRGFGKKHKVRGERPHKVLPCRFFQKGTCNKGDNCTYVHDLNM